MDRKKINLLASMLAPQIKKYGDDREVLDFVINRFINTHFNRDESREDRLNVVRKACEKADFIITGLS